MFITVFLLVIVTIFLVKPFVGQLLCKFIDEFIAKVAQN